MTATSLANVSGFAGATAAARLVRPLVSQRYRLAITDGTLVVDESGIIQPTEVVEKADLGLENPAFRDDIEVFTSIDLAALDSDSNGDTKSLAGLQANGLDRTAVTKGNRIVFGSEATGIWGALFHFSAARDAGPLEAGQTVDHRVLRDFLTAEDGVSLRVRQTNPGINEPASRLNLSRADPEDVTLFLADATELETPDAPGRFYLVIDTSDGGTTASAANDDAADGPDDDGESTDETASDDGEGSDGEPTANGTDGDGALSEGPTDDGSRSSGLIPSRSAPTRRSAGPSSSARSTSSGTRSDRRSDHRPSHEPPPRAFPPLLVAPRARAALDS
ncbi:hypothetical protein PM025_06075 [Halorubrum ezzemoulense]|uniref:hypothetical protein n=1 Tax=Halorubrum ezzemoulense TaxID=337243 RepID=UPI00232DE75E|nr:hypothetical protein [Halorubrum ezzemoulense]MDB2263713.1 hypothetical protein [Halorubrum ezzemoulense]